MPPVAEPLESRVVLAAVSSVGLVNWFQAEDNALDSGVGDDGVLIGGASFAAGIVGRAFQFDGVDDEIRVPQSGSQITGAALTIEAWVNPKSSGHGRPIAQMRSPGNVGGFTFETTHSSQSGEPANGLQFSLWLGDSAAITLLHTPAESLTLNTWQHVAATYDGATMRIYVNGVEQASTAASGAITPSSEPLVLGRNVVIPSFAWDGLLDEVSYYNRALSADEIQSISAAGSAGKDVLLSWYRAEEVGAEGIVVDELKRNDGSAQGDLGLAGGHIGQAFNLDGIDDSVDLGTWFNLQTFTIDLWVNPAPGASQVTYADILDNNHTDFRSWSLQFDNTGNQYHWGIADGAAPIALNLTPGVWQHIAVTRDGASRESRVYHDGVLVGLSTGTSDIIYDGTEFFRLGRWGGGERNFEGLLDEVRVHDRALTAGEIRAVAQSGNNVIYSTDFEDAVGAEWSSNGTNVTPVGGRQFLGEFGNDSVTLTLPAALIPAGTSNLALSFDLFVIRTWDGNHGGGGSGPDRWTLTANGTTLLDTTFSNNHPNSGFAGQAYPGAFGTGQFVPRTGSSENNTLGFTFPGVDVMDSVYQLAFTVPYTGGDFVFTFAGALTTPGSDESWGLDNIRVTNASGSGSVPPDEFQFQSANYEVVEGESFAILTVLRSGNLDTSARVDFETINGTAGQRQIKPGLRITEDFTTTSGTLFFKPHSNIATARVPIYDDVTIEPDETFQVVLSNPSAGMALGANASAQVTIHDNDPSVSFTASSSQRGEGTTGRALIEVRLGQASPTTVTVHYAAVAGSATAGVDFTPAGGTLTFKPGETRKFINFKTINDTLYEPGNETVTIELSSPTNGFIGAQSRHRVTIIDNDPEPPPVDPGSTPATALFIDLQTLPRQS